MRQEVIRSLQVFRGIAVVAVVAHHAALSTDAFVDKLPPAWLRAFDLGAYGVDFFFVLSGFIIMHTHFYEGGTQGAVRGYLFKRLTRILLAYWPVGLAVLGLYAALPNLSASGGREFSVLSSLLLLPADRPPALSVAWTLVHELMFYGLFMLWFVSRRVFWLGLLVWMGAIVAAQTAGTTTGWLGYPLSWLNVEFMLGVLAAVAYRSGQHRQHAGMFIAGGGLLALAIIVLQYQGQMHTVARLVLALGLGLLMLGFAMHERQRPLTWPALMLALGNASYSIYLVHNPLLSLTQRLAGRFELGWASALLAGVLVALLCGFLYFLLVERPVLRWIRTRTLLVHDKTKN